MLFRLFRFRLMVTPHKLFSFVLHSKDGFFSSALELITPWYALGGLNVQPTSKVEECVIAEQSVSTEPEWRVASGIRYRRAWCPH